MTAPLLSIGGHADIGRRVRDCEDGSIWTILWVDSDGDYVFYMEANGDTIGCSPDEVHDEGGAHVCKCAAWGYEPYPGCKDCYTWVKETE